MPLKDKIQELEKRDRDALAAGGSDRIEKHHASGRLTARERIHELLDEGSFSEIDRFRTHECSDFGMDQQKIPGDGVVAGSGRIDGRLIFIFAQDATVLGGSLGETGARKIGKVMEQAAQSGAPLIGFYDSMGPRLPEGVACLEGVADLFQRQVLLSGVIPQIACVFGPCTGGAVFAPALSDFVFMVKNASHLFLTGPEIIKAVTHEEIGKEALGGAEVHASKSGLAHGLFENDRDLIASLRRLLAYLPSNNLEDPPHLAADDALDRPEPKLDEFIPDGASKPYDMNALMDLVVDQGTFFEIHDRWAKSLLVGFAKMAGRTVGIIANQPAVLAGCLDSQTAVKGARFVRFCDAFQIPIVTFVDVPGFLPGTEQEWGGVARHAAKLLYAYAEATVPKVTVITRKAYGAAYTVMGAQALRGDVNFAYPAAEISVVAPDAAVSLLFKKQLEVSKDPVSDKARLTEDYRRTHANSFKAAELGVVDEVIYPRDTRVKILHSLERLKDKRMKNPPKKHGNIPL